MKRRHLSRLLLTGSASALVPCLPLRASARRGLPDLGTLADRSPDMTIWRSIVGRGGMQTTMLEASALTVFVPLDAAYRPYRALVEGPPDETAAHRSMRFAQLVRSHILSGVHPLSELARTSGRYRTLEGGLLDVTVNGTANLTLEWSNSSASVGAAITLAPIAASNGLLYPLTEIFLA